MHGGDSEGGEDERELGDKEEDEGDVVVLANAVADPAAVVVEVLHTLLTHVAVLGLRGPHHLAIWAEALGVEFLQENQEIPHLLTVFVRLFLQVAGADQPRAEEEDQRHHVEGIH